ncbi:hypothetical protein HMPREF9370_1403 [Neisseria wadsworthii 9715]|uniref:Uncharacterized protein n=1 Tax=Neisseria wadsworthii 9715 TaxID=1030841 RepID=G4CQP3_9NEIS|nr:hypothetical protein HMPREF9370_1403 [Neisseria wadsworthii 9715]
MEEFCKSLCLSESFQTGIVFGILSWFRHALGLYPSILSSGNFKKCLGQARL